MSRYLFGTLLAVGAAAVTFAAPAAADEAEFLQSTGPRFVYLTHEQLLSAGHTTCTATRGGTSSPTVVDMLSHQMGIPVPAADQIVRAALVDLC